MDAAVRVAVTVTFLRMDVPPSDSGPPMPAGVRMQQVAAPSVALYRFLYDTVGADYLWWLRRTMPDAELAAMLRDPAVTIHVLARGPTPIGFCELDARPWPDVNLSYFGLMPQAVGAGLGYRFLRQAVDWAWQIGARGMTVNTCTADHPRALPLYERAGFRRVRAVREVWPVPAHLGLVIPDRLRV